MLKNSCILIGASSEISEEFIRLFSIRFENVLLVSRNYQMKFKNLNQFIVSDYLNEKKYIAKEIRNYNNCIVIFFNGVLYENRPEKYPTQNEIQKTKDINFKIPYELTKIINKDCNNIDNYIYISSMAAVKPRFKNYIYGLSKKKLETKIKKLGLPSYLIIRFGLVFTQMSRGHKVPPFSLNTKIAAKSIYDNIHQKGLIYPKFGLKIVALLIKITPKFLIKLLKY